jgi:endonuclease III
MPVDTHVFRVANRLGLTPDAKTPEQSEIILMKHFPEHLLGLAHHWLILHGRYVLPGSQTQLSGLWPDCLLCIFSIKKINSGLVVEFYLPIFTRIF